MFSFPPISIDFPDIAELPRRNGSEAGSVGAAKGVQGCRRCVGAARGHLVFFVKKIFIYLLKLNGTVESHANAVFNHQVREALPIN